MVQRALTQLQPMLHGALPTEEIVKAMLDKITAEEKLNIKVQYIFWGSPTSRAPRRSQSPRQLPRTWRKRWLSPRDPIILDSPGRRQVEDFLTDQEKNDLRNLHGATMSSFIAASSARPVLETIPPCSHSGN